MTIQNLHRFTKKKKKKKNYSSLATETKEDFGLLGIESSHPCMVIKKCKEDLRVICTNPASRVIKLATYKSHFNGSRRKTHGCSFRIHVQDGYYTRNVIQRAQWRFIKSHTHEHIHRQGWFVPTRDQPDNNVEDYFINKRTTNATYACELKELTRAHEWKAWRATLD